MHRTLAGIVLATACLIGAPAARAQDPAPIELVVKLDPGFAVNWVSADATTGRLAQALARSLASAVEGRTIQPASALAGEGIVASFDPRPPTRVPQVTLSIFDLEGNTGDRAFAADLYSDTDWNTLGHGPAESAIAAEWSQNTMKRLITPQRERLIQAIWSAIPLGKWTGPLVVGKHNSRRFGIVPLSFGRYCSFWGKAKFRVTLEDEGETIDLHSSGIAEPGLILGFNGIVVRHLKLNDTADSEIGDDRYRSLTPLHFFLEKPGASSCLLIPIPGPDS